MEGIVGKNPSKGVGASGKTPLEFRVLGPLDVAREGRSLPLPRGRGRALLALLILRANEVIANERLIDALWGEAPPPTANKSLQNLVSDLRKRLGPQGDDPKKPSVLQTASPGYVLRIEREQVDANQFRLLLDEAAEAPADRRASLLRTALGLWRGPALADFSYEPFAQAEIAALEDLRLTATEESMGAELALARHAEVVGELEGLVAEHPYRERLRGYLMLALYRCGRQAEALEVYRDGRGKLVEELGVEPGPELSGLEQAILRQDPALQPDSHAAVLAGPRERRPVAERWLPAERKDVTVLFVELAASPESDGRDLEFLRRLLDRSTDLAADILRRHGASVEIAVDDVLVGFFGLPTAYEDHALRAVRAATELSALPSADDETAQEPSLRLVLRAGIETGEVLVGGAELEGTKASGHAVNLAATLMRAAKRGEVLLGDAISRLIREAARLEPVTRVGLDGTGISISIPACKLIDLLPGASPIPRVLEAPMVGRRAELARMRATFERLVEKRRGYRFTVLGDAGVGKSRLATELARLLGSGALVLTGHCPAYGEGITFWPLREVVLDAAGSQRTDAIAELLGDKDVDGRITRQVASAIGSSEELGRPDELFPSIRQFFEALSSQHPVVVTVEDAHWAEPTFLDLIEYLAETVHEPLLLLCLARPELLEDHPRWDAKTPSSDALLLEPLDATETERLISDRLAGDTLPAETLALVAETAQGNPLFVEQMVAAFRNEGTTSVPASVHALLAARLDRLGPAERDLLRCAAIMGRDFTIDALAALIPEQARPFIGRHLQVLVRKQLLRPAESGERRIGFRHALIQLAAYRSTTRADRARLHERFAEWLEREPEGVPPELDEIVGYHLERAVKERRMLGVSDEHGPPLAVRAGERLARAGIGAYARFDIPGADNLLSRARELLPPDHPQRLEVMRRLAEGYPILGRHAEADEVLATLQADLEATGNPSLEQTVRLERARVRLFTGPDPVRLDAIREDAATALELFDDSQDHAGMAKALFVLALVHRRAGAISEMEEVARRGLAAARRADHKREEAGARWNVAWAVQAGRTPVREAIPVCEELVESGGILHPGVLCELAVLRAMVGDFEQAHEAIARARADMMERDLRRKTLLYPEMARARIWALSGDLEAAEEGFRTALGLARDMGVREHVSQLAATLSLLLSARGAKEESATLASLSTEAAPSESVAAQALWRVARARAMPGAGAAAVGHRLELLSMTARTIRLCGCMFSLSPGAAKRLLRVRT